ncbi:hypothetical protein IQ268_05415 [Oculatella sp. LEGE 06141]|uniref:hypothetical protein n=1 Tax=Oculatella sp. LEGE 06141 TaxID=1828648 RepID=UPI00187E9A27|nr:hypothetical protein [Oculatella sp. LEGE 06141]MBE9178023.1 hypothetical protein [Oculatella sp. LEGE 06141]
MTLTQIDTSPIFLTIRYDRAWTAWQVSRTAMAQIDISKKPDHLVQLFFIAPILLGSL